MRILHVGLAFLVTITLSSLCLAQDTKTVSAAGNQYLISAKAGGVNAISGTATIVRSTGKSGQLMVDDKIEVGDVVETGASGMVEILLNPGSFLRLGPNSSFTFKTTELENLSLNVSKGTAILEIYANNEFKVSVSVPGENLVFNRSGVFRIDLLTGGQTRVSVWKGQFLIGKSRLEVNAGRSITFGGPASAVAKFDRDGKDALDIWSQLRGKEAARINDKLNRGLMRQSLMSSFGNGVWDYFSSFGVWVFDPQLRRWCFLPFGAGWYSPYGHYYGFNIFHCRIPQWMFVPQTPVNPPVVVNPPVNPGTGIQPITMRDTRRQIVTPPAVRFEQTVRNETRGDSTKGSGGGSGPIRNTDRRVDDSRSNQPVFAPSQPSNPAPQTTPIIVGPTRSESKKDN